MEERAIYRGGTRSTLGGWLLAIGLLLGGARILFGARGGWLYIEIFAAAFILALILERWRGVRLARPVALLEPAGLVLPGDWMGIRPNGPTCVVPWPNVVGATQGPVSSRGTFGFVLVDVREGEQIRLSLDGAENMADAIRLINDYRDAATRI